MSPQAATKTVAADPDADHARRLHSKASCPPGKPLTLLAHAIARRVGRLLESDTEQLDLGDVLDEDDLAQAIEALRFSAPAERSEAGVPLSAFRKSACS